MFDHRFAVRDILGGAPASFVRELVVLLAVGSGVLAFAAGVGLAVAERIFPTGDRPALGETSRSPEPASGAEASTLEAFPAENPFVEAWKARLLETPPRLLDAYLARPEAWASRLLPILERHEVPREFL
ncbi:MAG: hypothetical protein R3266_14090, partial [Gemmatimonadota bacterium]|nr:hypothetical protein [Gemmatimonadota bacterium]